MKKILSMLAVAAFAFVACDSVEEDYKNGGNISLEDLKAKSTVTLDKVQDGRNGNVLTCNTAAAVNARWSVDGKEIQIGNYAWKKLKLGEHTVTLEGLCPDGTLLKADYPLIVDTITNKLTKYIVYGKVEGDDELVGVEGDPFRPAAWDAAAMRFSENEGKFTDINGKEGCFLPYLTDEIYWGFKTLIFDISDASPDMNLKIMTGWWSPVFVEDYNLSEALGGDKGLWELPLTQDIAAACAKGKGGEARDLDLMLKSGSCTINAIYYEE